MPTLVCAGYEHLVDTTKYAVQLPDALPNTLIIVVNVLVRCHQSQRGCSTEPSTAIAATHLDDTAAHAHQVGTEL